MSTVDRLLSELRQQDVKLWLDGDRLRYRAAKDSLNPELLSQLKTQKNAIVEFLKSIESQNSPIPPLEPADRTQNLPLSFGQQRLWFVHQFEPNSSANNVPVTIRFTGNLNIAALEQSVYEIAMRHETLRTSFPLVDGKPIQLIDPDFPRSIPIVDLQDLSPEQRQAEARTISAIESRKPFDLEHGPIARFMLIKFDERDHLLIRNMHCIICDGASCDLFHLELIELYTAFAAGQPSPLAPLSIQYADFSVWQRQWLQGETLDTQVNYWKQKLAGNLSTIRLPYDHPRPPGAQAYLGNSRGMMFTKTLNQALTQLSQQCGVTFFMLLLTAFEIFLYRYSGQEDLLISFASAARGQVETEQLLGFFSNTLFLRTKVARNLTCRELLDRVRQDCLAAFNHQDVPFEKLIEEIKVDRDQERSPLFQTKFTLNLPWSDGRGVTPVELPDLKIAPQTGYVYPGQTKYDLILVIREQEEGLRTVFDYNADLFDIPTIDRMLVNFQNLLEGMVANPDCPIAELPLFTGAERQQLFANYHRTSTPLIDDISIQKLCAAQSAQHAAITPQLVADSQIYILEQIAPIAGIGSPQQYLQPAPIGVLGEIWMGNHNFDRSALELMPHPDQPESGEYLYRSGKLGRYLSDGKIELIDRIGNLPSSLPTTNSTAVGNEKIFATADNPLQFQLTKIWENVLGIEQIGLDDNFFDIGGNSLIAVRIFSQIEQTFSKNLPLSILFQTPTIAQLAHALSNQGCATSWAALVPIQTNGTKPPLFLIHSIGGNVLEYSTLASYFDRSQPVYGLQSIGLDGNQPPLTNVTEMATRYLQEIQTIQPQGPYYLAGYSFGGLIAIEIAQQLHRQSQPVALVGLLDTRFPHLQTTRPSLAKFLRVHLSNLWQLQHPARVTYIKNWFQWYSSKQNLNDLLINNWYQIVDDPQIIKTIEANLLAYANYTAQFYPGTVTLFRSSLQPVRSSDILDLGWSKSIGGDLEIEHIPGEHYGVLKEPHVRVLAEKLQSRLE